MSKGEFEEKSYTRIANDILEGLYRMKLSGSEMQILLCIIRHTYGYNVSSTYMTTSFIADDTNMNERSIKRAIKHLAELKIIKVVYKGEKRHIGINKHTVRSASSRGDKIVTGGGDKIVPEGVTNLVNRGDKNVTQEKKKEETKKEENKYICFSKIFLADFLQKEGIEADVEDTYLKVIERGCDKSESKWQAMVKRYALNGWLKQPENDETGGNEWQ